MVYCNFNKLAPVRPINIFDATITGYFDTNFVLLNVTS